MNNIIVLDLGSESMCALLGNAETDDFKEINLQYLNNIAVWEGVSEDIVRSYTSLLWDESSLSNRLLNKIGLRDFVVRLENQELAQAHAKLDFNKQGTYQNECLFRFYHRMDETRFLCNPKVAHVKGIRKITPEIFSSDRVSCKISPNSIIKHLTALVINNLILYAPECRDINPDDIKLILTVPNVYSPTHVQDIVKFVKEHSKIKNVDFIYESYAAAYSVIGMCTLTRRQILPKKDKEQLIPLAERVSELINSDKKYNIISIDIGKGTSDLSFFNINEKQEITVVARTGIAKAGNSLDYIIVRFLDNITNEYYKNSNVKRKYDFIHEPLAGSEVQQQVNILIQKLVLEIKKNITKNYSFKLSFARQIKEDYLNFLSQKGAAEGTFFKLLLEIKDILSNDIDNSALADTFKREYPLFITRKLVNQPISRKKIIEKCNRTKFEHPKYYNLPKVLKKDINDYVLLLSKELPHVLKHNIENRTESLDEKEHYDQTRENTFLLITGQAAQFAPLNHCIINNAKNCFELKENHILSVKGIFSKKICSYGGFLKCLLNNYRIKNPDELLLDYFIRETDDRFHFLPYKKLNSGELITISGLKNQSEIWFSTLLNMKDYKMRNENVSKEMFFGFIKSFSPENKSVQYDRKNKIIKLDHTEVNIQGYGEQGDYEDIIAYC